MIKVSSFVVGAVVMLLASVAVMAQAEIDLEQVAAGMKSNQEALRDYAWQSRVSVEVDGEEKKADLYQVRYNMDGELEKTRMGGEAEEKKVRGPMRKHKVKKAKKNANEFAGELGDQIEAYLQPDSVAKALSTAFARVDGGILLLHSQDIVQDGDSVDFGLVETTKQPMTLTVETTADGSPVEVEVTFQRLDDGPNYAAQTVVNTTFEGKKLKIVTENFSYAKQGG